ncbi:helix-turn-helix domain-containing protein [Nocardioides jiangxiensis]|uniref:Helix-turn-helix transcriptional regulator n=1 Tax=Nocardioides jiangxiensis TaxID=3064524 RepID=A0ABT9AX54_9ACTN|nr:helix-turn-helix transcriptional regulator [Nocardioides sp. WY-20]MDO7866994.1 helix-turn-helix transcriptional regulator [Nocardioides sp. WY-20]
MSTNEAMPYDDHESGRESTSSVMLSAAPDAVEVRRNGGLAALLGGASCAVAIGYLARAVSTASVFDWALAAVLGVLGAYYLHAFVDARTPLMVADTQGVRIRLGRAWRGIPWGGLASVEVAPSTGFGRDGRLTLVPRNAERVLASFDASGRRQGRLAERLYGSPFAVPLGLSTRVAGVEEDLTTSLRQLAGSGARVVELVRDQSGAAVEVEVVETTADTADERSSRHLVDPRPAVAHAISSVSDALKARSEARAERRASKEEAAEEARLAAETAAAEAATPVVASPTPAPLREARAPRRAELTSVPAEQLDGRQLRRPGSVDLVEEKASWGDRVRPLARLRETVEPLVIDDFAVQPAADPVIGPDLKAARTRIGLSVEQLAERTRIRPHVIESIEVDDFVPCGGDFYARGHLRTLARVLGLDPAPLLATYDERYADAEINPRRVFEAELASGATGGMRSMRGGPNWSVLVAAVMAVVLAWSIARLVMDDPAEVRTPTAPSIVAGPDGSGVPNYIGAQPVKLHLEGLEDGARVVVKDDDGVAFRGSIAALGSQELTVMPPFTVSVKDQGAVQVTVDGKDKGVLDGATDETSRTFKPKQ